MNKYGLITALLLSVCALCSCNGYEKMLKSDDYEAKYAAAVKYYEEGSYTKAVQLFENLQLYYRGRDLSENIHWYYAQTLIKQEEYYMASYQLVNFMRRYPYSEHAEEAAYQAAICQYHESPAYSLDQSMTKGAIQAFETFAERYPSSVYMPQVNAYLDELNTKLMRKDYEIAVGYYNVEQYRAAYVALNDFLNKYPDSPNREDAMYYILCSGYEYGINSREDKIKERLQLVVSDFDKFATTFSNSKYIAQARKIYTNSKAKLAELEEIEKQ